MRIDPESCSGCRTCISYCPVGAITSAGSGVSQIDPDQCVECGVCLRAAGCPTDSFTATDNPWPRSLRALFSDPTSEHVSTRVPGRGTEEMKTNDVTGRYASGEVGLNLELGRPGIGTRLGDVEPITRVLAELGVRLEPANPVRALLQNPRRGLLDPSVREERVLSILVECSVPTARLGVVLERLHAVAANLPNVLSVGLIQVVDGPTVATVNRTLAELGLHAAVNGKVNVGLGRRCEGGA